MWFGGVRRRIGCVGTFDTWDLGVMEVGWQDNAVKVIWKSVSANL